MHLFDVVKKTPPLFFVVCASSLTTGQREWENVCQGHSLPSKELRLMLDKYYGCIELFVLERGGFA